MEKIEIALDGRTTGPIELADEEFLRAIVWKRSAPKRIRTAAASGDVEEFLHQWRISLGQRVRGDAQGSGVSWSQAGVDVGKRTDDLVALIEVLSESGRTRGSRKGRRGKSSSGRSRTGNKERLLVNWLEDVRPHGGLSPLEVLALLEVLGQLDVRLSTEALWIVWRRVFEEVIATSAAPAEGDVSSGEFLLAAGELPYLAGLLFDGVKGAGKLSKQGRRVLRDALIEQTDTDGTPDAELVDRLAAWLAPLIRATAAAKRFETELWNGEDVVRFELLIEVAAAMCAPDGKLALSNGSCREPLSMLLCGTEYSGMSKSRPARAYLQSIARRRGGDGETRRGRDKAAITPVSQSDWAQLACMRSDWSRAADTLVVAHHRVKPWIDLTAGGRRLLSGAWDLEISIDGTFVELCDDWECVCWYSDDDCDYLEMQLEFEDGFRVDRQILLSREDQFAIFADVVLGSEDAVIEYHSRLPVVQGVDVEPAGVTRESVLSVAGVRASVYPLALPQDRVLSTPGGFGAFDGQLVLKQRAEGKGLYAPIVIDWKKRRKTPHVQWRTLTVSEDGERLGADVAAGHRLRIGKDQLLVYRSLTKPEWTRAVLGHHTLNETVIARFDKNGDAEPILLVE